MCSMLYLSESIYRRENAVFFMSICIIIYEVVICIICDLHHHFPLYLTKVQE